MRSARSAAPSARVIASTAIRGLTFGSIASRQASTASSRRSAPSAPSGWPARRAAGGRDAPVRRSPARRVAGPARPGRNRRGRPAPGPARRAGPGGPRLLPPLQLLELPGAAAAPRRRPGRSAGAEAGLERLGLGARRLSTTGASASASAAPISAGGVEAGADRGQRAARRAPRRAPPGLRVAGQPAGPPTCPCAAAAAQAATPGRCRPGGQHLGDRVGGRLAQRHQPASGPDGHRDVVRVRRRGAEQEHRPRRRLLDRLEQGVGGLSVSRSASSISTTCQRPRDGARPARDQRAHFADADGQPFGHHDGHVGVGAGQRGVAPVALAAAAGRALQRGGERPGGDRPARAGRPGEDPGVGHRAGCVDRRAPFGDAAAWPPRRPAAPRTVRSGGEPLRSADGQRRGRDVRLQGAILRTLGGGSAHRGCAEWWPAAGRPAGRRPEPHRRGDLRSAGRRRAPGSARGRRRPGRGTRYRTRSWKSSDSLSSRSLSARPRRPGQPDRAVHVQQHHQVGLEPTGGPGGEPGPRRPAASGRRPARPATSRRTGR